MVAECYVKGVSTRRVDGLVKTLGIEHILKEPGQRDGEELGRGGRGLPQPAGRLKVRAPTCGSTLCPSRAASRGAPSASACVVASAVNAEGYREILRAWTSSQARMRPPGGSFWPASWNVASQVFSWWSLTASVGLGKADRRPAARRRLAALPNALHAQPADPRAEEAPKPFVATWCAASSLKPSAEEVAAQLARVTEQLRARFSQVAERLADVSPGRDRLRCLAGRALALGLVGQP